MSDHAKNIITQTYKKSQSFQNFVGDNSKAEQVRRVIDEVAIDSNEALKVKYSYGWTALQEILTGKSTKAIEPFILHSNEIEDLSRLDKGTYLRYLDYRYRYEIFPKLHIVAEYPPCVQIEPASICNYRCVFCYQTDDKLSQKKHGHMGIMSLELFKSIIDELEGKVEAISLASRGEPTLCKDLGQMLLYMKGKFLGSKMNTNASKLTEKLIHDILSSELVTLVFSADAAEDPMYGQLRVNGSLEKVLKNIRLFNEIKEKHYPDSKILTRVSGVKVNEMQDIEKMESLWGELVDQVAFVNYCPWVNCYESDDSNENRPCSDLWRRMFIWWDGKCNPCDVDYLTKLEVGQFSGSSVKDLWRGDIYESYRSRHLNDQRSEIFPCNKCYVV